VGIPLPLSPPKDQVTGAEPSGDLRPPLRLLVCRPLAIRRALAHPTSRRPLPARRPPPPSRQNCEKKVHSVGPELGAG